MFTGRFDATIWNPHLLAVMPNLAQGVTIQVLRRMIYDELEQLRGLRNRIAHHEPIFPRALTSDFQKIHDLINFRCAITAAWMLQNQQVTSLIGIKPP